MDAWSADQLKKMQAGGNGALNEFFKQYGVDKYTDIRDKYNNRVAEVGKALGDNVDNPALACKRWGVLLFPSAMPPNFNVVNLQIYREKIKAAVEGRPFNPPPPSAVQVNLNKPTISGSSPTRPGSAGASLGSSRHDEWDDWGDKAAASGPNNSFANNSEYSRAQYMASAANKDEFFARKMQENQSKPDHLPPNQGGKYVGFGSTPPPRPAAGPAPAVDDVTALFSKGLQSLGQVAGMAASTATVAVHSGTQNLNQLLQEKQVAQTLQQTSKVVAEKAQVGHVEYLLA